MTTNTQPLAARSFASRATGPIDGTVTLSNLNLSRATLAERFTLPQFRLRVLSGPDAGKQAVFAQRVVLIGTAVDCDFALTDSAVSREHLRVTGDRVGYRLRDLGSKNGTWFAGSQAIEMLLGPSATLRLGQTELQYEQLADMHEVALARETELFGMQGQSEEMRELFAAVASLGAGQEPVAVEGEAGTGKRMVAMAAHRCSPRAGNAIEYFDCATADWTAAERDWQAGGRFWQACAGGTLVLLDADEMPADAMAAFLPAFHRESAADAGPRLLCTLSLPLPVLAREGRVSKDFAKLFAGRRLRVPPLRQRPADIAQLVQTTLAELEALHPQVGPLVISWQTMQGLLAYPWPGNVRELRRHLEFAAGLATSGQAAAPLQIDLAGEPSDENAPQLVAPFAESRAAAVRQFERRYCSDLMAAAKNQLGHAAQLAEMSRASLESLLARVDRAGDKS